MGTITAWVNACNSLTVTGVKRSEKFPPLSINSADIPFKFLMLPSQDYQSLTTCSDTNRIHTVQIAIATEAVGQSDQPTKYDGILTMVDNLNSALETNKSSIGWEVTWSIEARAGQSDTPPLFIAGVPYWGVLATVTGSN